MRPSPPARSPRRSPPASRPRPTAPIPVSAGMDTWCAEPAADAPLRTDYPFFDLPDVIGSPHNSSIGPGTMLSAARVAAGNVRRYLRGQAVRGVVRRADYVADHGD